MAAVLDQADRLGVYSLDGHRNVRSWAAANVNWSNRESLDRARTVRRADALFAIFQAAVSIPLGAQPP